MQFIETSDLGVRSAVYRFKRLDMPLQFMLFPMIHIGSREYYAAVQERLSECDFILAEGVKSKHAALLVKSYEIACRARGLNLVTQREFLRLKPLAARVLNADISSEEFENGWADLSLIERALVTIAIPFVTLYLLLFGSRRLLAKHLGFDDLPSREEIFESGQTLPKLDHLIAGQRDARLILQFPFDTDLAEGRGGEGNDDDVRLRERGGSGGAGGAGGGAGSGPAAVAFPPGGGGRARD